LYNRPIKSWKKKRLLHEWRQECSPVVSGEVEDSKKCFAQVLIWVGRVRLLPARGCELIDQQGSHPILQWICIPHQTDIYKEKKKSLRFSAIMTGASQGGSPELQIYTH